VPENSRTDLFVAIGLIIGVPIIIDATGVILERKGIDAGAWLRTKLHLKPKKSGPGQESEKAKEDPPKPKDSPPQRKSAKPPSTSTKKKR